MYNILVVGAGYVGKEIASLYVEQKQRVYGLVQSEASAKALEDRGVLPIIADLTQPDTLKKIPPAHFIIFAHAPKGHSEADYQALYLDGLRNFLVSQKNRPRPFLMVYLSSTSVWSDKMGNWIDENTPVDADNRKGQILIQAEQEVLQSGYPSLVFRLSGIYGPGRNRLASAQAGTWPIAGEVDTYVNMIHRDDIARAVPVLIKKGEVGQVYLGVDDEPVKRSDMAAWIYWKLKKDTDHLPFKLGEPCFSGKRCRNHKLKELGFTFFYPTFREGYDSFQ